MRFSKAVVKYRIPILILTLVLLIPSVLGMIGTRINYDMLTYLPEDMETVIGQNELMEDFDKGAFAFLIVEDMPNKDVAALKEQIEQVDHVDTVLWYDSIADISVPMELLPDKLYHEFNTENATMMAVFFDSSTSADVTMDAVRQIRGIAGKQCFLSGLTAMVVDLKDLCEREEPIYVGIAVALALVVMLLLSAVLQLAVTMDYFIFLWHSYNEQLTKHDDSKEAMANAIRETLTSIVGSSITTVAGFIALCFMSFTLGRDLGIVMAKGVILGVIGCVTVLPGLILVLDKPLQKAKHRSLIPNMRRFAKGTVKAFPVFLCLFVLLIPPALYGYNQTNNETYYNLAKSLPDDMEYVIANSKLSEDFDIASTHMLLVDKNLSPKSVRDMMKEMEQVDGVKYVLGLESVIGPRVPEEVLPESITGLLKSDKWELLLLNSEYPVASDEVGAQIESLNTILKKYDPTGMLIGEAPCMKDMIDVTSHDFEVVNAISIVAIFLIIALVERSASLPFILISVIELAIFINLGLPHYLGQSLPFIAPICISTIQLGATVDYAILMTTRYKSERIRGQDKKEAVRIALTTSIPSILVSGFGLFAATFGVALYSKIDMISSICMLLARGAVISLLCVILILPALLLLLDKVICVTTLGMKQKRKTEQEVLLK